MGKMNQNEGHEILRYHSWIDYIFGCWPSIFWGCWNIYIIYRRDSLIHNLCKYLMESNSNSWIFLVKSWRVDNCYRFWWTLRDVEPIFWSLLGLKNSPEATLAKEKTWFQHVSAIINLFNGDQKKLWDVGGTFLHNLTNKSTPRKNTRQKWKWPTKNNYCWLSMCFFVHVQTRPMSWSINGANLAGPLGTTRVVSFRFERVHGLK